MSKRKLSKERDEDEMFIYEQLGGVKKSKEEFHSLDENIADFEQNVEFMNSEQFLITGDQELLVDGSDMFVEVNPESAEQLEDFKDYLPNNNTNNNYIPNSSTNNNYIPNNNTSNNHFLNNLDNIVTNSIPKTITGGFKVEDTSADNDYFQTNNVKIKQEQPDIITTTIDDDDTTNDIDPNNNNDDLDLESYTSIVKASINPPDLSISMADIKVILTEQALLPAQLLACRYFLQNSQELNEEIDLKSFCSDMDSTDIRVDLEARLNPTNNHAIINILDIVMPFQEPETPVPPKPKRQRLVKSKPPASTTNAPTRAPLASWSVDHEFKTIRILNNIPDELEDWTSEHVALWLKWASRHFRLNDSIFSSQIGISGREVSQWRHDDVKIISPNDGDNLFWTHLQILKKCKLAALQSTPIQNTMSMATPGRGRGMNGQIQLWQFLLETLINRANREIVEWVGSAGEFRLIQPESVARLWGQTKNKDGMTYEKMSRAMRYYYDGDIIHKVPSKRFHYKFVCDLKSRVGLTVPEIQQLADSPTVHIDSEERLKYENLLKILRTPGCLKRAVPINNPNMQPTTQQNLLNGLSQNITHEKVASDMQNYYIISPEQFNLLSNNSNIWLNNNTTTTSTLSNNNDDNNIVVSYEEDGVSEQTDELTQQQYITYISHEQDVDTTNNNTNPL